MTREPVPPGAGRRAGLPNRPLPALYLGSAHLFLAAACATILLDPGAAAGFFYQPRTVAIVHMVTLGWITLSILGSLYIIGPIALRMPMPARPSDYAAFALCVVGILGMIGHFLIAEYVGMAWSAATLVAGLLIVAGRALRAVAAAPIQGAVKLHLSLAFLNLLGAAALGILLGLDKRYRFLPARVLSNGFAHLHLAALGWATMMVMGAGYRLLPLPALLAAGGLATFLAQVRWMRRRPLKPPSGMPRPDYGVGHALAAMAYAAVSAVLGLVLSARPTSEASVKLAAVYGVFGLVGFLGQMIVGIEGRLVPMFASYHSNLNLVYDRPAPKAHELPDRRLQAAGFALWAAGVPALAGGLVFAAAPVVAAGAAILLLAVILGSANLAIVMRHAWTRTTSPGRAQAPGAGAGPA